MINYFIDRPIFAWVIAILISLGGVIALSRLGVESYPAIAPPQVNINASYPGADAATVEKSVTEVIEQQLTGIDRLMYFSSTSSANGGVGITLTFEPGTDPDIAAMQTQNKVALATPRLPSEVVQQGVTVSKSNPDFLMFFAIKSTDGRLDSYQLNNLMSSSVILSRRALRELACFDFDALALKRWMNAFSSLIWSSFFLFALCFWRSASWLDSYQNV